MQMVLMDGWMDSTLLNFPFSSSPTEVFAYTNNAILQSK